MAILYFQVSPISRGTGRSVVAAAAYRSGERLRDERTGKLHNFSRRVDVPHKEILLPTGFNAATVPWVKDRQQLWNAAERAERQRNARTAREFQVALPHELSADQRQGLAREFSQMLADRYHVVVDLAIHEPRPAGDPRNHHAHLLLTSREITPTGFGAKAGLDMRTAGFRERGWPVGIAEIKAMRQRWAALANEALRSAGLEARVDHRTLLAQGIDRMPRARLPYPALLRERRGQHSEIADRVRANHMARVQAKRARLQSPASEHRSAAEASNAPKTAASLEQIQREAREAWLSMRRGSAKSMDTSTAQEHSTSAPATEATLDDDHTL